MLDELARRTCFVCGAVLSTPRGRTNHERWRHPEWEPTAALRRERTIARNRTWKDRQSSAWKYLTGTNQAAKKYGHAPIPIRTVLPDGPCVYCGGIATGWDHVVPLSRGGEHSLTNLVPACWPCNHRKNRYSAAILTRPPETVIPCAWCWTPVVRKNADLHKVSYVVCSREHQSAMRRSPYLIGWRFRVVDEPVQLVAWR